MTLDLSIPLVDAAIGHSMIYEEYKGDYAAARQMAEQAMNEARAGNDRARLGEALLARGVVHLLQGETRAALSCFDEIHRVVPKDATVRLRAESYTWLATILHFNTFPNGSGANAVELSAHWQSVAAAQEEQARWQALLGQSGNTLYQFEGWLVYQILPALTTARAVLPMARYNAALTPVQEFQARILQMMQSFRQAAAAANADPYLVAFPALAAAGLYRCTGDMAHAGEWLDQALVIYRQGGDAAGAATCHMIMGDWASAPCSTPVAWNLAMQDSGSEGSRLGWALEAEEFTRNGMDLDRATRAYADADNLYREAHAARGLAALQLRYGYLDVLKGDFQSAARHAQQAEEAFQACGDLPGYWTARAHRALSRIGAGEFPEDTDMAQAIGAWGANEGSLSYTLGLGILMNRVGHHWLLRQGDYERALACYRLAETLFRSLGVRTNVVQSLVDQGETYHAVGERQTALTLYEQALDLYQEDIQARPVLVENLRLRVMMLANTVYQLYLQTRDADGMEKSAARIRGQIEHLPSGDAAPGAPAGVDYRAVVDLGRSTVEQASVQAPLFRAQQARASGQDDTADTLFAQALTAARAATDDQKDWLEASVHGAQRKTDLAVAAFRRYLDRGGANAGYAGELTRWMVIAGGDLGQREAHRQARRTHDLAFTFLVNIQAYAEAQLHLQALEELDGPDWWAMDERPWESLGLMADMWQGLGELERALDGYDRAIAELERRRVHLSRDELKTALAGEKNVQYLYFGAARASLELLKQAAETDAKTRAAQVLAYAERGKARALLDLMAGSAMMASAPAAESDAMRAWRQLNAQLSVRRALLAQERSRVSPDAGRMDFLSREIETGEQSLHEVEAGLAASQPDVYRVINPQAQTMSLEQISAALPADTALLQYYFLGDHLLAWAITREGMVQHHLARIDRSTLDRKVRALHTACEKRGQPGGMDVELAAVLLDPFTDTLRAYSQLLIVPYGTAHRLPFHVLPFESQPLVATHTLAYLPSASILQFVSHARRAPERILAVGNPSHMSFQPPGRKPVQLQPLQAAEAEAAYVASLFPEHMLLTAGEATEDKVRHAIPGVPLLHFATHGYLSDNAPLLSAILLANGDALNVYELMGLRLDADLVVLSACHTGEGEVTGGDDVVGFTRGLLATGARAAVVSLWAVDDYSTALLMGEFYKQLCDGATPARALQAAQNYLCGLTRDEIAAQLQEMGRRLDEMHAPGARDVGLAGEPDEDGAAREWPIEQYRHPYYWAPFILVGANL